MDFRRLSAAFVLALSGLSPAARADPAPAPFAPAVETLADKLKADFVIPPQGDAYADAIRHRLAIGDYDKISDPKEIAARLTADLQAVKREGHLRVKVVGAAPASATHASADEPPPISEAKWIAPGVAYIGFTLMPDDPQVVAATDRFMRDHASARALIIDSRKNHGGGEGVMETVFQYLFPKTRVVALFDQRTGVADAADDDPYEKPPAITPTAGPAGVDRSQYTVIPVKGGPDLFHARVFYLTSSKTGSGAEEMAQILKSTGRGTVVGERTAGAGHFGFFVPIGEGLEAFMPWGRVLDPTTGKDYEGTGVAPDIEVPADQALNTALRLAAK